MQNPRSARDYPLPHAENLLSEDQPRLAAAINAIDADITELDGRAASVEAGVATLSTNDAAQSAAIAALQGRTTTSESNITALQGKVSSTDSTLDTLQKAGDRIKAAESSLSGKAAASHTHGTGDITGLAEAITAGNVKLPGDTLQRVFAEVIGPVSLTSAIPMDNTIPQSTEGNQVLSATITPGSASSIMLVEAVVFASETSNVGDAIIAALFQGSQADAVAVGVIGSMNGGGNYLTSGMTVIKFRVTAGATDPITFAVRVGNNNGAATLNATHTGATLGSKIGSYLAVTEIKA